MIGLNDLTGNAYVIEALKPQNITSSTTTNGVAVDLLSYAPNSYIHVIMAPGVITDGSYAVQVKESDDNSTYTNITDGPESGVATLTSSDSNGVGGTTGAVTIIRFPRTKRYVRITVTSTSVTTGGYLSGILVVAKNRPGNTSSVP